MYPVFIPTKSRANTITTTKYLYDVEYYLVIEPQDLFFYSSHFFPHQLIVLEENNQGIHYVKNYIKLIALTLGLKYYWLLDDNLHHFYIRQDNRNIKSNFKEIKMVIESFVNKYNNIGQCCLIRDLFAWTMKDEYKLNKQMCNCVLNLVEDNVWYDSNCIDDTDYSLQILDLGYTTIQFNRCLFKKPPSNRMKGGFTDKYKLDGNYNNVLNTMKKYNTDFTWFRMKVDSNNCVRLQPSNIWRKKYTQVLE